MNDIIEGGTVVGASQYGLVVEVEGIEVYVGTRVHVTGCACCGDTAELTVSYNRPQDVDGDPLGLE